MEILPLVTKVSEDTEKVQQVLDLPELKMIKPSDTQLVHEQRVKSVKRSYSEIVLSLNNIYEESLSLKLWD